MITILVIDDDELLRRSVRNILERKGYGIIEAKDGTDGLVRLQESQVDLVITDIFMPVKDGFEIIEEIREKNVRLKIIAMSGGGVSGDDSVLPLARKIGADAYIHKPFRSREILTIVENIMEADRQRNSSANPDPGRIQCQ